MVSSFCPKQKGSSLRVAFYNLNFNLTITCLRIHRSLGSSVERCWFVD